MCMRQSEFPLKTQRNIPSEEEAINAILLTRAGFIQKVGAGIWAYLPLGLRVLERIINIVRQEMNAIGAHEILLPALHPKEYWVKTGRWETFDALYKIKAKEAREYALGATHEEIVVPLAKELIQSYKDLPLYVYQIQTKFRDEHRAKSGMLRGREFLMKDLYSFHESEKDLNEYYEKVASAYEKIFTACGLDATRTEALGGTFSKFSHEYQVENPAGEDVIFVCSHCHTAKNKEIIKTTRACNACERTLKEIHASEVGNIFKLGTAYSKPFDLTYQQEQDKEKATVVMGCYGIGISRLMGVIVEVHHDDSGIIWPEGVAPFSTHLLKLRTREANKKREQDNMYQQLQNAGIEVLYDNREEVSDGQKFVEADLIGIPWRAIVSERTLKEGKIEVKKRSEREAKLLPLEKFIEILNVNSS